MNRTFRFSILPLLFSLLFAFLWSVIGGILYHFLVDVLWTPLLISLYFTGLALMLLLSIVVSNAVCRNAKPQKKQYTRAIIVIICILISSMLFEFLYELSAVTIHRGKPTSYIFLMDCSSSMNYNDPSNQRLGAMYDVIEDCSDDFPCAVYSFGETCSQLVPITPASQLQRGSVSFPEYGGTDILGAVSFVLNDIKTGTLDGGASPRIVLLSDGESGSSGYRAVVSDCLSNNVSVSCIALGSIRPQLLQQISSDTRGTFAQVSNASHLSGAMNTAATSFTHHTRDLLGYRPYTVNNGLYAFLRILFMLILSAEFLLIKVFMFSTFDSKNVALYSFIGFGVLGALAPELGINLLGAPAELMRLLVCLFFALLWGSSRINQTQSNTPQNGGWNPNTGIGMGTFSGEADKWKF